MIKILIIRFSSTGDVLLTTPVIRALRTNYPDAIIDFAVKKQFAPMIEYNPAISTLLTLDSTASALKELKKTIQKNHYDIVIDLHRNFRSSYLKLYSRATTVSTIKKDYFRRFLLVHLKINLFSHQPISILDRYQHTVSAFVKNEVSRTPELHIPGSIVNSMKSIISEWKSPRIVFVPGSAHPTKEWPADRFGEAGAIFAKKYKAEIIVVGGSANKNAGDVICTIAGSSCRNLAGSTTLLQTAAIIKAADIVITVETGCMHIGWSFRKKMVCIFGSTVRELGYFPEYDDVRIVENYSLRCRPCSHNGKKRCPKKHFKCMNDISVTMVVAAAEQLL